MRHGVHPHHQASQQLPGRSIGLELRQNAGFRPSGVSPGRRDSPTRPGVVMASCSPRQPGAHRLTGMLPRCDARPAASRGTRRSAENACLPSGPACCTCEHAGGRTATGDNLGRDSRTPMPAFGRRLAARSRINWASHGHVRRLGKIDGPRQSGNPRRAASRPPASPPSKAAIPEEDFYGRAASLPRGSFSSHRKEYGDRR